MNIALENSGIRLIIDADDGCEASLYDKNNDSEYRFTESGFVLSANFGVVSQKDLHVESVVHLDDRIGLTFRFDDVVVDLFYQLPAHASFYEKWITVTNKGSPCVIEELTLQNASFVHEFREIHFHDDQTIWHCPINLFLRGEKGGLYAGLEYPYWECILKERAGYRLGHLVNARLNEGETWKSEIHFCGAYGYSGEKRISHGPYPGGSPARYVTWEGTGLAQHFKGFSIPEIVLDAETLDWGEVSAMQELMGHVLVEQPMPENGYWIFQNGWWAGLFVLDASQIDVLVKAGIHDVMTAHTWFGRGIHPHSEEYFLHMDTRHGGYPVIEEQDDRSGISDATNASLHDARHASYGIDRESLRYAKEFTVPKAFARFIAYARSQGVHVGSFSVPGMYFDDRPEWASIDSSGAIAKYLFGRKVSCPACDDYMEFVLGLHRDVFKKLNVRYWGFDGRWLSYDEIAAYAPEGRGIGSDCCHSNLHGHEKGDNRYKEWVNIRSFISKLRESCPNVCLEAYYGLKRGGPWALQFLNGDEGYYESNGAVINRLQAWHNQNDRFRPVHLNFASIFGKDDHDFEINVLSAISISTHGQVGQGFSALDREENRTFLKRWRAWAAENESYLRRKKDLFGCPGYVPVDGSAHIIGSSGCIFAFSPRCVDPQPRHEPMDSNASRAFSITLSDIIGLQVNPGGHYSLTEIYPTQNRDLGTFPYGQTITLEMAVDSAMVIAIEPQQEVVNDK